MSPPTFDPVELEVFRHIFISIADEMGVLLRRTAFSPNIKERRDYSCAVYDAKGDTVAMGDHMPVHLGAMPLSVRHAIDDLDLEQGDVAILNDPFAGGTHLPDITAVAPVFNVDADRPSFYVACRAHHADVGGMSAGSMPLAREIYQEGLRIPPVHLQRRGQLQPDILRLILANVRTPDERTGDLTAQLRCLERGADRLLAVSAKYGQAQLAQAMAELQAYAERRMRAAIEALPDGEWSYVDWLDNDGISQARVEIHVKLVIDGDTATVDFTGSSPQTTGSVNANHAIAVAATMYVFRCLLTSDVPFNAGLLRPVRIVNPEGSVVNARLPAAMAAGNVETSQRITDALLGALRQAAPALPAASSGTMTNLSFGGINPRNGQPFAYYETIAGGMGAGPAHDGRSATHTHMTNSWNTPIEALEHQFPIEVRQYRIRKNSGGAGVHRGGDGVVREIEFQSACEVTLLSDRRLTGPWGVDGGLNGLPGSGSVNAQPIPGKVRRELKSGDRLSIETPGGGGWGTPV